MLLDIVKPIQAHIEKKTQKFSYYFSFVDFLSDVLFLSAINFLSIV